MILYKEEDKRESEKSWKMAVQSIKKKENRMNAGEQKKESKNEMVLHPSLDYQLIDWTDMRIIRMQDHATGVSKRLR